MRPARFMVGPSTPVGVACTKTHAAGCACWRSQSRMLSHASTSVRGFDRGCSSSGNTSVRVGTPRDRSAAAKASPLEGGTRLSRPPSSNSTGARTDATRDAGEAANTAKEGIIIYWWIEGDKWAARTRGQRGGRGWLAERVAAEARAFHEAPLGDVRHADHCDEKKRR